MPKNIKKEEEQENVVDYVDQINALSDEDLHDIINALVDNGIVDSESLEVLEKDGELSEEEEAKKTALYEAIVEFLKASDETSEESSDEEETEGETEETSEEDKEIEEETAAAATLAPNAMPAGAANKAANVAKIITMLLDKPETINHFMASLDKYEPSSIPDDAAEKNKASISAKPSWASEAIDKLKEKNKELVSEEISSMFEGQDLSDEFKEKAKIIVESAIQLGLSERAVELEKLYEESFETEMNTIAENLVAVNERYLEDVVADWAEENALAIETSIRSDLAEAFIEDLKAVFEAHYVNVPEEKLDLVDDLLSRVEELEAKASELNDEKIAAEDEVERLKAEAILKDSTKGLSESQVVKLSELAEKLEYSDSEDFKKRLTVLRESVFKAPAKKSTGTPGVLFEDTEGDSSNEEEKVITGPMAAYVRAIDKATA